MANPSVIAIVWMVYSLPLTYLERMADARQLIHLIMKMKYFRWKGPLWTFNRLAQAIKMLVNVVVHHANTTNMVVGYYLNIV